MGERAVINRVNAVGNNDAGGDGGRAGNRGAIASGGTSGGGAGGRVKCGYCKKCKVLKPARAHHCHVCDQCIVNVSSIGCAVNVWGGSRVSDGTAWQVTGLSACLLFGLSSTIFVCLVEHEKKPAPVGAQLAADEPIRCVRCSARFMRALFRDGPYIVTLVMATPPLPFPPLPPSPLLFSPLPYAHTANVDRLADGPPLPMDE